MTEDDIQAAVWKAMLNHQPFPEAFAWSMPKQYEQFAAEWPGMSLDQKVGHIACLTPFTTEGPLGLIHRAYLNLCATGGMILERSEAQTVAGIDFAVWGMTPTGRILDHTIGLEPVVLAYNDRERYEVSRIHDEFQISFVRKSDAEYENDLRITERERRDRAEAGSQ